MKIIKGLITFIITIILLIITSFNLYNFISINVLDEELPKINGYAYLEVVSGSMEPKFKIGDVIIIDTKISKYKEKDIVTFKDINGSFVTHRIVEINDEEIVTKGDANNTIDEPISKDTIVGKYVYRIGGVGAIIKSLRSPFVLVMILIIGILLCIFVSTDSKGNAILTDEEREYMDFLEYKKIRKHIKDNNELKELIEKNEKEKEDNKKKLKEIRKKKSKKKRWKIWKDYYIVKNLKIICLNGYLCILWQ